MEEKRKLYDAILTEGARWLAVLEKKQEILFINNGQINTLYKCFLEIARIASNYNIGFYIRAPWYKYLYLKYIKRFKFLKWPRNIFGYYIDPFSFLRELSSFFNQSQDIFYELYNEYYRR